MTSVQPTHGISPNDARTVAAVRWRVGAKAAAHHWGSAAPRGGSLILEIAIRRRSKNACEASISLSDPDSSRHVELDCDWSGEVKIARDDERGLVHIDADSLVMCSIDPENGAPLFVRTPIFKQLDIKGGRYEPDSASVNDAESVAS